MSSLSGKLGLLRFKPDARQAGLSAHPLSLRRMTSLTLALLLVIAAVAVYGIRAATNQAPAHTQFIAWCVCAMLVCSATVILLLGRHTTARLLRHIESQLRRLVRSEDLEPLRGRVPDEMGAVMDALGEYVSHVNGRLEQLRFQKKEVDIQMRVADAERRHTEAVIVSISDAVLVIDSFGELALANTAAEKLFAFRLSESRHRPIERVIQDSTLTNLLREARTASGPSARRQVEYCAHRAGTTQTFNITLSTVLDAQGQARGVVAVFHDITREREIARMKTDFVSAVSHELRTPLSSIKAYVEMLVDGEAHDERTRKDFYGIIESETDRLQRLINKILDISRIESGVMEIHLHPVQLNALMREAHDVMLPQAAAKNIDFALDAAEELPALLADRDLVYQAVLNLVSNAVKYTPAGGRVRLKTSLDPAGRHICVGVTDNGLGIRPEDLPHLFEKFFRSRDSERVAKGTGLGLNLVKHIVETVHGGDIAVTSEYGAGTTMVLRFPLARQPVTERNRL